MNEKGITESEHISFQGDSAVDIVQAMLERAAAIRASDIHVDPSPADTRVRMRIDGELGDIGSISARIHEEVIARLKILSGARTDLHAIPQDGRFRAELGDRSFNVRISFMPTYRGENAVLRLLPASGFGGESFAALGFSPDHARALQSALEAQNGLILVTGPTGSGKTTTLRVCLSLVADKPISVMTLEDPVEYEVPGVRHVHIRESYGVSFAAGLRSALRQDPDVIMVGEIRDAETARTAVNTALTGHLVLSTLHTTSALEAILRLSQMGVEGFMAAATLRLIVSQRLVHTVCQSCHGAAQGCAACRGSGFAGRSVIAETLEMDDGLRDLILRHEPLHRLAEYAVARGFRPISEDAAEKVEWGVTTRAKVACALDA